MKVILAYGFRPFFLLMPLAAVLAVLPLPVLYLGGGQTTALSAGLWHGHEQVFGVLTAALAGFLLTALPSWTGIAPLTGRPLAALVLLWLAGRLAMILDGWLPPAVAAGIDTAFLPLLLLATLPALAPRSRRPWEFVAALALLGVANLGFHLGRLEVIALPPERGLYAGLDLFMILIALALGRILPVTLRSALDETGQPPMVRLSPGRRHLASVTLALFAVADLIAPASAVTGWIALAAACAQADRMVELHNGPALTRPQVLLFYLAQGWMVLGLGGLGLAILDTGLDPLACRHALGPGAAATVAVTVMSVVSLRHTGRPFPLPTRVWIAPALVTLAALLRVLVPHLAPHLMPWLGVTLPTLLWAGAFLYWLFSFAPWLLAPRVDGQPG